MNRLAQNTFALFAIMLLMSLTGCMTAAEKLEKNAVNTQLHSGQTQAEVRRLLGHPVRTTGAANGKTVDIFIIVTDAMPPSLPATEFRSVYVLYDPAGHLEEFTWYRGETRDRFNPFLGRIQSGRAFTAADLEHIKRNSTTRDEMIRLFGPATIEGINAYDDKVMSWIHFGGHDARLEEAEELTVVLDGQSIVTGYSLENEKP